MLWTSSWVLGILFFIFFECRKHYKESVSTRKAKEEKARLIREAAEEKARVEREAVERLARKERLAYLLEQQKQTHGGG